MSAFCDGKRPRGLFEKGTNLLHRENTARTNRMGRMVNVCKNASRQRTKPNKIICKSKGVGRYWRKLGVVNLFYGQWNREKVTNTLPLQILVRL